MKKSNHDNAILIFSKPIAEEKKVLVGHNRLRNKASLVWLRNRTIQLAKSTGLPYYLIEQQYGKTFGERLTNTIQQVFDKGYKNVIVLGNDCAELTKNDLAEAIEQVESGRPIIGPDQRQGAYLIGLNSCQFDADRLAQLPWQSKFTFSALVEHLKNPIILEHKADLNAARDLRWLQKNISRSWRKFMYQLVRDGVNWVEYQLTLPKATHANAQAHRGPPINK